MERKFSFAPEEYYHIYNRGTDKRDVFINKVDYERCMKLLYLCNSPARIDCATISKGKEYDQPLGENIVDIGAWCLMPNHFHILVRAKASSCLPKGYPSGVSLFMNKLQTAYSMYFNKKYKRNGRLFQGTFKAKHIDNDEYLKYLFAYVHLNPIKLIDYEWEENEIRDATEIKEYLMDNQFSSYLDYMDIDRQEQKILNKSSFPDYFENTDSFEKFIDLWTHRKDAHLPPEG